MLKWTEQLYQDDYEDLLLLLLWPQGSSHCHALAGRWVGDPLVFAGDYATTFQEAYIKAQPALEVIIWNALLSKELMRKQLLEQGYWVVCPARREAFQLERVWNQHEGRYRYRPLQMTFIVLLTDKESDGQGGGDFSSAFGVSTSNAVSACRDMMGLWANNSLLLTNQIPDDVEDITSRLMPMLAL